MTATKMFVTIRSQSHLSRQRFHDHWRHPHGTWGRGIASIMSYVQSHRIDTPHLGTGQQNVDGVVEVSFENAADVAGMSQDPAYLNFLKPDEPSFVENTGIGFMAEQVLRSGPPSADGRWPWREAEQAVSIKLIQVSRSASAPAWDGDDDLALADAIGALRVVRAAPNAEIPAVDEAMALTAIRQFWWPTLSDFEEGIAQDAGGWRTLIDHGPAVYSGLFQAERFI